MFDFVAHCLSQSKGDNPQGDVIDCLQQLKGKVGELEFEQKFSNIVDELNRQIRSQLSSIELYPVIFPEFAASITKIDNVFYNAIQTQEAFNWVYHPSEKLYHQWVVNFRTCPLVEAVGETISINMQRCKEAISKLQFWTQSNPSLKDSSMVVSEIRKEFGLLPLMEPVIYLPKHLAVKKALLEQLARHDVLDIVTNDDKTNKLEFRKESLGIIVTRKQRFPVTPELLRDWVQLFGINVSLTTMAYIIEFGMPYAGRIIGLSALLDYKGQGWGVIGRLGDALMLLMVYHERSPQIEIVRHPLRQSAVLALAQLEYRLNPTYI
jgi:hypothetical protein